jgi:hypothetical protein
VGGQIAAIANTLTQTAAAISQSFLGVTSAVIQTVGAIVNRVASDTIWTILTALGLQPPTGLFDSLPAGAVEEI